MDRECQYLCQEAEARNGPIAAECMICRAIGIHVASFNENKVDSWNKFECLLRFEDTCASEQGIEIVNWHAKSI
jgi:hypothetical protein